MGDGSTKANKNTLILITITALLVSGMWLVPLAFTSHPGLLMSYRNLFDIHSIIDYGYTQAHHDWLYLSWPGFQLLNVGLVKLFNWNPESILRIFPFIMQSLMLIPLYVFLRNTVGKTLYVWLGIWLFCLGNWIGQEYFGPQAFAMLLLLTALALVSLKPTSTKGKVVTLTLLTLVVAAITMTHMLTSLVLIAFLGVYLVITRHYRWSMSTPMMLVTVAIVLVWNIALYNPYVDKKMEVEVTNTPQTTQATQSTQEEHMLEGSKTAEGKGLITADLGYIVESNITKSISGSALHKNVVLVRLIYSMLLVILAAISAVIVTWKERSKTNVSMLLIGIALVFFLPLRAAGWELGQRLLLFGLPLLAYFGTKLVVSWKDKYLVLVGIFLVLCIPVWFVSHYGNQTVDQVSNDYIEGIKVVKQLERDKGYLSIMYIRDIGWNGNQVAFSGAAMKTNPTNYIAISDYDVTRYEFLYDNGEQVEAIWEWLRDKELQHEAMSEYALYWSNDEFEIYKGYRASNAVEWEEYQATSKTD